MPKQQDVGVRIASFYELTNAHCPLALDSYQRAYVWGEKKIVQLLTDFQQFIEAQATQNKNSYPPTHYYMGSILLHKHSGADGISCFVIDGQQRLTSLAIMYWLLKNELPNHIQFCFRSPRSMVNIKKAKQTMLALLEKNALSVKIFDVLRFTVITVMREDLAFTFFDTQNNRGVPLGGTDLLKAFHLRAIHSDKINLVEQLQSHCARRWEQVQTQGRLGQSNLGNDFAPELFHYYLWRSRNWTGTDVVELESLDELLIHFGDRSAEAEIGEVVLYPASNNQWGKQLRLTANNDYMLQPSTFNIGNSAAYLPFALRQPISRGVGFFLYAEKYSALLNLLLNSQSPDPEVRAMQVFYEQVVTKLSAYLQSLYRLALLAYFDRLGSKGLLSFALWLNHRFGAIRLRQADIRRETPLKFLRDAKRNLLDVIAFAYRGEDVIQYLKQVDVSKAYADKNGWLNEIVSGRLVQERYAAALAKYYNVEALTSIDKRIDDTVEIKLAEQGGKHD
ncbi:DUF262 domain-containing protein [Neptunomonas qingdaonensis]|uniref:Uncharacterized protein n=1 Tax=Neptunomonas qingdaonensis TaxID=1045558 RepID=A0A1I2QNC7_9GAMM|nr:DUF262 domain-containing protein [Neptunomonas qingdaonensis]SFG29798.1 Protein of unknown function DUF262 [Neptunomonas qingdaonensis]